MSYADTNATGLLDKVRLDNGIEALKIHFYNLVKRDKQTLIEQINDENLHFCSLYILRPDLAGMGLISQLNTRNQNALRISDLISAKRTADLNKLLKNQNLETYNSLKWILLTGYSDDGFNNRFDEVLELSAALLIRHYRDNSILQLIMDMAFKRYKNGRFIHNLIWSFFEARSPQSLVYIANGLYSPDSRDYELACKLLNFIPCVGNNKYYNRSSLYNEAYQWIQDNSDFLYYTGESLHHSGKPQPYTLIREAKYLCKPVENNGDLPLRNFSEEDERLIKSFNELTPFMRESLSNFSYMLYRRNNYKWRTWIRYPVSDQIRFARMMGVQL